MKTIQSLGKSIAAALLLSSSYSAWADGVSIGGGLSISLPGFIDAPNGTETLTLGSNMLEFMDLGRVEVNGVGGTGVATIRDLEGLYSKASITSPISSHETVPNPPLFSNVLSDGGMNFSMSPLIGIGSGGALTISNLSINTQTLEIKGDLFGTNGLGSIVSTPLWNAKTIHTSATKTGDWDGEWDIFDYNIQLTGLALTDGGKNAFIQSFGLLTLGQGALNTVKDFGSLDLHITVYGKAEDVIPAVPEPSTYALMGVGLMGLALMARRGHRQPSHG